MPIIICLAQKKHLPNCQQCRLFAKPTLADGKRLGLTRIFQGLHCSVRMAEILFIISAPSGSGTSTLVAQVRTLVEGLEMKAEIERAREQVQNLE
jgi:ABC-type transporter Mla maintaining outer membrane lipid asymmetry ATPase subunit MlaF